MLIRLAKKYKHLIFLLIAINLNKARKMQIAIATAESIPNDCKHPINQYFLEYLYTLQKQET